MRTSFALAIGLFGLALLGAAASSYAQEAKKTQAPAAAATGSAATTGSVGSAWSNSVSKDGSGPEQILDDKQVESVKKVSGYFNELANLRGTFLQTDPDKKRVRGKFYVKRPGRFRFDYGAPSKKIMISDGRFLYIQDPDVKNPDTFEMDNTPFRLLLRKDVDLLRDSRIAEVQEADDLLVVTMQDKSPDVPGKIQLYFVKRPILDLKEWVVTDAQGLETRVEVSDLNRTEEIDPSIFRADQLLANRAQ